MAKEPNPGSVSKEERYSITAIWDDTIAVKSEGMSYNDFLQYIKYHEAPGKDLDTIMNYGDWCANRGFKTFMYPHKELHCLMKLAVKILLWTEKKTGNISNKVIARCPDNV